MRQMTGNRDYVAALLHGRRSRMAEGSRLDALCRLRSLPEFVTAVLGESGPMTAAQAQRHLLQLLADEIAELSTHLSRSAAALVQWLAARFQVENVKVLLRRLLTGKPIDGVRTHLIQMPAGLQLNVEALASAGSLAAFADRMPAGLPHRSLLSAIDRYHEQPRAFYLEAALDRGYFAELLFRANEFKRIEGELARPMILQEADIFHLMLVTRGRFIYGLEPASLVPLRLPGTHIPHDLFEKMLSAANLREVALHAAGRVIDLPDKDRNGHGETFHPGDPGMLERMAWSRFWRLANRAFRRSHMGLAAVLAYLELRRVEVANLITICEGIRTAVPPEALRARLVPSAFEEGTHV
ncbi:MAG: V-type ATPase subunit [Verrucomicrobiia bacterium]